MVLVGRTAVATAAALLVPVTWAATFHLCGDSTMAKNGGGGGTQGWGEFLQYSFSRANMTVHNAALAGRSARSYTREGRFRDVAAAVRPGDWVLIEFGHNDGGGLHKDNGRSDCPGVGNETCITTYAGVRETVLTFPAYVTNATELMLAAGAQGVVIASQTPNNPWESGTFQYGPSRFVYAASIAATDAGGPDAGVYFVDHGGYTAQVMKNLGVEFVDANYPEGHTHTAAPLSDYVARAFVLGLQCGTSPLREQVLNSTSSLTGTVLGSCLSPNSGQPPAQRT